MNNLLKLFSFFTLCIFFTFISCDSDTTTDSRQDTKDSTNIVDQNGKDTKAMLMKISQEVVNAIDQKDWERLASFVHPRYGLRISPYPNIDTTSHRQFSKAEITRLGADNKTYFWGYQDGSGDSIKLNFADYYGKYLYNKKYISTDSIGYNKVIGGGNAIYNYAQTYPGSMMLEFYIPGSNPEYGGMDWGSLILVFSELDDEWYLRSLAHGQWTI